MCQVGDLQDSTTPETYWIGLGDQDRHSPGVGSASPVSRLLAAPLSVRRERAEELVGRVDQALRPAWLTPQTACPIRSSRSVGKAHSATLENPRA